MSPRFRRLARLSSGRFREETGMTALQDRASMRPWGLLLLLAATSALYLIPGLDGWTRVGLPVLAALVVAARLASVRVARFIAAAICAFMGLVFLVGLSFVGWSLQPPSDAAVMTLVGVIAA